MGTAGTVMITGTGANDQFIVSNSAGMVSVMIDGQTQTFNPATTTQLMVFGGTGDVSVMIETGVPIALNVGGGPGNDTISDMSTMPDTIRGGGSNDSIVVNTTTADMIRGGTGNDTLVGGGPGSMLIGGMSSPGKDLFDPQSHQETVMGGAGSDTVSGAGHDSIMGGAGGNIFLDAGNNKDSLNGGGGLSFAQYNPTDTMTDIFEVFDPPAPTPPADAVIGASPAASAIASATVTGGILVVNGSDVGDTISVALNNAGTKVKARDDGEVVGSFLLTEVTGISVLGGHGNDSISVASDIKLQATLSGVGGNDTLVGGGGSNVLIGGAGNDSLTGGSGTNLLIPGPDSFTSGPGGNDTLNGGTGTSIADFSHRTDSLHLSNNGLPDSGGTGETSQIDTNIQAMWGGTADDTIVGTHAGEFLSGGSGANLVKGGGVSDLLVGGSGSDSVAVAAEPVVLYLRNGEPDQYKGVTDPAEDLLQLDTGVDSLVSSFTG
jgi:Ca2+-binding RTX toxin-like protein